jgi:hypothetical protein
MSIGYPETQCQRGVSSSIAGNVDGMLSVLIIKPLPPPSRTFPCVLNSGGWHGWTTGVSVTAKSHVLIISLVVVVIASSCVSALLAFSLLSPRTLSDRAARLGKGLHRSFLVMKRGLDRCTSDCLLLARGFFTKSKVKHAFMDFRPVDDEKPHRVAIWNGIPFPSAAKR